VIPEPSRPAPAPLAFQERRAEIAEAIAGAFDLPPGLARPRHRVDEPMRPARKRAETMTNDRAEAVGVVMMVAPELPPEAEAFYDTSAAEYIVRQASTGGRCLATAPKRTHDRLMKWALDWDATGSPRLVATPCPEGHDPDHRFIVYEALAIPKK
jgi:hypothetical protein